MQCHLDAIRYSFASGSHFRMSSPRAFEALRFQARNDRGPLLLPAVCLRNYSKFSPVQTKEPVPSVVTFLLSPCLLVSPDKPVPVSLSSRKPSEVNLALLTTLCGNES